jgi:hypothetical protein
MYFEGTLYCGIYFLQFKRDIMPLCIREVTLVNSRMSPSSPMLRIYV